MTVNGTGTTGSIMPGGFMLEQLQAGTTTGKPGSGISDRSDHCRRARSDLIFVEFLQTTAAESTTPPQLIGPPHRSSLKKASPMASSFPGMPAGPPFRCNHSGRHGSVRASQQHRKDSPRASRLHGIGRRSEGRRLLEGRRRRRVSLDLGCCKRVRATGSIDPSV